MLINAAKLLPQEIDCYVLNTEYLRGYETALRKILTNDDFEDIYKFKSENLRSNAALYRGALRRILSKYSSDSKTSILINKDYCGKPFSADLDLSFNISHSTKCLVVAVCGSEVGVDCENGFRGMDIENLFTEALKGHPLQSEFRPECISQNELLRAWTEKEAFAKAVGLGLSLDFDQSKWRKQNENSFSICYENSMWYTHYLGKMEGSHISVCNRFKDSFKSIKIIKNL